MSAFGRVAAAAFHRWKGDSGLAAYSHALLLSPGVQVWETVPSPDSKHVKDGTLPTPRYPRLVMGEVTEVQRSVMQLAQGWTDTLTVDVWSQYPGRFELQGIVPLVHAAVREPLTVAGFGTVTLRPELTVTLRDPSGLFHAPIRYRFTAWEQA